MELYLKQKVFSIGEKFNFFDENQNLVYSAKGSIFSFVKRFELQNNDGISEILIERKLWSFMPKYRFIDMTNSQEFATMKKHFTIGHKYEVNTSSGKFFVEGSLFGYNFRLYNENNQIVTSMQKAYLSWGDTYEISINENLIWPKLVCAIMVAFDNAVHNNNNH